MTKDIDQNRLSTRQFIDQVRKRLCAQGRPDILLSRLWIETEPTDEPFVLNVPIGPEYTVGVRPINVEFWNDPALFERTVGQFADALINLRDAEQSILNYVEDVRLQALKAITSARDEGFDIGLEGVNLRPVQAIHLSQDGWEEAASYIVAVIKVRHLSSALQYEVSELQADNPQVLEEQLLDIKARHAESQVRLHELDQSGYDLELDTLTYDLLNTHFEDIPALLKTIWKQECINLEVDYGGRKCPMSISSFKGRVTVNLHFDNLFWNSEHLWYPAGKLKELSQNAVLGDYIAHPAFANRPILKIESGLHDLVSFDLSDRMLFDAESASVWGSTRLAA